MDFVQATMVHESTGLSPFELELGWHPRQHFDWQERARLAPPMPVTERMNRGLAQRFAKRCHDAVEWAKQNVLRTQQRQSTQANKHRRPVDFDVGDLVYVQRKNWTSDRPSTKLDYQNIGPYQVLERVGHAFRLDLPANVKIHPVITPDRLRRAASDPLPGQVPTPQPPVEIDGEPEWEVQRIVASRIRRGKLQYQADWIGYDKDDTWYPASDFRHAPTVVQAFHTEFPNAAGPPVRLQLWLSSAADDKDVPDHPDNDKPSA